MRTDPSCVECFIRQGADVSLLLPEGEARDLLRRKVQRWADEVDLSNPPVAAAQDIHRMLRELIGDPDPYRSPKRVFNALMLEVLPELRTMIARAPDRLLAATRLAIAANIIDFGPTGSLTPLDALHALRGVLDEPFHADWESFVAALATSKRILYLTDNAGEIVVDRLLIEALGPSRVTVAVRGGPVINDATLRDAQEAGLDRLVKVIDNGSDAPGTLLANCSAEFRDRFDAADLIIAKGQGNFEALNEIDRPLFFLFKVKCATVARYVGLPTGTHVLLDAARWRSTTRSSGISSRHR